VAVADAFDVMTAARSYKRPMRADAARQELAECAGRDFDPEVVRAFLDISIGRVRWALGLGALFAVPLMPRSTTQTARNTAAGSLAAVAALAAGVLPLQAAPATQVLGENFTRPPQAEVSTPSQPSAGDAGPAPSSDTTTTTTTAPTFPFVIVPVTTTLPSRVAGSSPTTSTTAPLVSPAGATTTTTSPQPAPQRVAVDDVVDKPVKGGINIEVLANDSEPGGVLVPRSVSIVVPPMHGKAHPDNDGRVNYDPRPHYTGRDTFTYSVCDTNRQCFTAQVTLTVAAH